MERRKYKPTNHQSKVSATLIRNSNKKKFPDGFIYVLQYGNENIFKFGVSSNPDRRIKDIDSSSPVLIKEIGRFHFYNVYEMEECIHDNLTSCLIRREWFKMQYLTMESFVQSIKEMSEEGIYLTRK